MSNRSSAVSLLAAVFFAGIATTLGVLRVAEHRQQPDWRGGPPAWTGEGPRGPRPGGPEGLRGPPPLGELVGIEVTDRMVRELRLTDDQRERLEAIIERRRIQSQEMMAEVLPRLRSQMDSLHAEVEAVLSDEQRAAWEQFRQDDRARFRRRGGRPFRSPGVQ